MLRRHDCRRARRLGEDEVAHRLSERVVDLLEIVEVEDHHREQAPAAVGARDSVVQAVGQERPVRQPGERFVVREARKRLLRARLRSVISVPTPR